MYEPPPGVHQVQKPILIEVEGQPLGVVVAAQEGYRFVAVKFPVFPIDGKVFPTIEAAQEAAARLLSSGELAQRSNAA